MKPQVRKKRVLMANLTPEELTCETCNKTFPALYKLKIHKLTHSDTFPFMCANCGKGFNNKYKLHSHEKKQSCKEVVDERQSKTEPPPRPIKSIPCKLCPETFPLVRELKEHIQSVHKAKPPIVCLHCNATCRSQKTLVTHLKAVHNDFENGLRCCSLQLCDFLPQVQLFSLWKEVSKAVQPGGPPGAARPCAPVRVHVLSQEVRHQAGPGQAPAQPQRRGGSHLPVLQ